jgi:hypothetical protein
VEPGPDPHRDAGRRLGAGIAAAFAALLHGIVGIFYLGSGLVAPAWAVVALVAFWVALAVLIWRGRTRGPVVLAIPFVAAALWWLAITLGESFLGWTA